MDDTFLRDELDRQAEKYRLLADAHERWMRNVAETMAEQEGRTLSSGPALREWHDIVKARASGERARKPGMSRR